MRILIDGDSCCVMHITEKIAHENDIECHIYSDTSRIITPNYDSVIHTVDKGPNAVDFAIANACCENDVVITNDVGLATLILSKKGLVLSPYGVEFTNDNIMSHLNDKFIHATACRKQARVINARGFGVPKQKHNYKKALTAIIRRASVCIANSAC